MYTNKRNFSQTKNLRKYALNKHMRTVDQGKRSLKKGVFTEGENDHTTDYVKPITTKEIEPIKPI